MAEYGQFDGQPSSGMLDRVKSSLGRIATALFVPTITFVILWQVFILGMHISL